MGIRGLILELELKCREIWVEVKIKKDLPSGMNRSRMFSNHSDHEGAERGLETCSV